MQFCSSFLLLAVWPPSLPSLGSEIQQLSLHANHRSTRSHRRNIDRTASKVSKMVLETFNSPLKSLWKSMKSCLTRVCASISVTRKPSQWSPRVCLLVCFVYLLPDGFLESAWLPCHVGGPPTNCSEALGLTKTLQLQWWGCCKQTDKNDICIPHCIL